MNPSGSVRWQVLLLTVFGLGAALLWYAAFAHTYADPDSARDNSSSSLADPTPSLEPTSEPTESTEPTADPSGTSETGEQLPEVKDLRRADFTAGDPLPDGSRTRDNSSVSLPMTLTDGLLVHGPPAGARAASWLETRLGRDVSSLGARVRFPAADASGSIALVAWQSSVVDWSAPALPPTGMRLVAEAGRWRVAVFDGSTSDTILEARYESTDPVATFTLVRQGETLWVQDPVGQVSSVTDPRVAQLAGPWASWELREDDPEATPAAFEEVWAG